MQVAWTTDIHLDRLSAADYKEYKEYLLDLNPEMLMISGDISEGEHLIASLLDFERSFSFPIYFVLGNHDFYGRRFEERENEIRDLVSSAERLCWLSELGAIELTEQTALLGIEGWGDNGYGTIDFARGYPKDLVMIQSYQGLDRNEIADVMQRRGRYYADALRPKLIDAVSKYKSVLVITHVPPFVEACYDRSMRVYDEFRQPYYACKAVGDLLLEVMTAHPACELTLLSGHTHENADVKILENLRIRVKESGYGTWWNATLLTIE